MSHTNTTTNYSLPQFQGTDKPAWLGDINPALSTIDTQMKANADSASSAGSDATSANTKIGTLTNLTTTDKTDLVSAINEVDSNADTAQGTANQAVNTSASNAQKIAELESDFNLTATQYTSGMSLSGGAGGTLASGAKITVAKNSSGSLCKIYGNYAINNANAYASSKLTLSTDTGLRPTADISVNNIVLGSPFTGGIEHGSVTIKTNGKLEIEIYTSTSASTRYISIIPVLIFVKDFGDEPSA